MAKARDFFAACKNGRLDTVKKLVESKKVYPSTLVDDRCNGFTPLHHAAENGHLRIMQYLVEKCNCNINAQDSFHGKTPLHYAAENGHLPVVQYLVGREDCSFDVKSSVGKTAQKYAGDNDHGEVAVFLIEHAAKKQREDSAAFNPKKPGKADAIQLNEGNIGNLKVRLREYAAKWRSIGSNLGFRPAELDGIQSDPNKIPNAPHSFMEGLLDIWIQWAPEDGRGSKDYARFGALKAAIRRAGLGRVAAELTLDD